MIMIVIRENICDLYYTLSLNANTIYRVFMPILHIIYSSVKGIFQKFA